MVFKGFRQRSRAYVGTLSRMEQTETVITVSKDMVLMKMNGRCESESLFNPDQSALYLRSRSVQSALLHFLAKLFGPWFPESIKTDRKRVEPLTLKWIK